jgi:hypothetical protein
MRVLRLSPLQAKGGRFAFRHEGLPSADSVEKVDYGLRSRKVCVQD